MESPTQVEDEQFSIDPSEPFKGIVVCCTSIPPQTRTEIAQKVVDLGGVHKYDLTPDVTHLIVGDYDTPKYRHVARERQDIRAMDATWVDAVSQLWKNDEQIDFLALEKEHQLKAFEMRGSIPQAQDKEPPTRQSLLICLTGFGYQRDEIAETIIANGGRHTDDLTRRCTHLIVNKPEGKKFTAAKSWNIRTVTLDWLNQSASRGMILEEERFDPLLPVEEQGVGAWVKKDPRRQSLGKRSRSGTSGAAEDGTRKLRKTASMKLSSQRNNLWGDILGRSDSREYSFTKEHEPEEPAQKPAVKPDQRKPPQPAAQGEQGIFAQCIFYIHGFAEQRTTVLSQTIKGLDGQIASTLFEAADSKATHRFLIVPQTSQPDSHPSIKSESIHVVTEFYVEKCLHNRQFFPPSDHHTLGRPFPLFPIPGFGDLTICTAAFTGIELSQVARSVAQLGARFEEQFRQTTSVLVCKSLEAMRKDKLRAALAWGVPVVSADWLWECISTGYNVPVDDFIFPELKDRLKDKTPSTEEQPPAQKPTTRPVQRTHSEPVPKTVKPTSSKPSTLGAVDPTAFDHDSPDKQAKSRSRKQPIPQEDSAMTADFNTARTHQAPPSLDPPLTELSPASLNKSPSPPKSAAANLPHPPRTKSDPTHDKSPKEPDPPKQEDQGEEESRRRAAKAAERQALTSKLTTLLDSAAGSAPGPGGDDHGDHPQHAAPRPRRRQILGRAVSNVSAGSNASAQAAGASANADQAEEEQPPPPTQIEYYDPEARGHKAALMDRMMGGSGDVGKAAKAGDNAAVVGGGRSLRKR